MSDPLTATPAPAGDSPRPSPGIAVEQTRDTFREQVAVLVTGNFVFVVTALISLSYGYHDHRGLPRDFLIFEGVVVGVGSLTAFPDVAAWIWAVLSGRSGKYEPSKSMTRYIYGVLRFHTPIVFGLSFVVLIGVTDLVRETGLGIESPFIPMVAAPAVFGPFVARNRRTVAILLVLVSAALAAIAWGAPMYSCPGGHCIEAQQPDRGVYFGVVVVFLAIAGRIAGNRLERENELKGEIAELQGSAAHSPAPADAKSVGA